MSYLLDTNVISEIRKGEAANESVLDWYRSTKDEDLYLSVMVVGEIQKGIEQLRRRNAGFAAEIESWLDRVRTNYGHRVLPVDVEVAAEWGRMSALDSPPPVVDGIIAATAKVRGLTVVSRNTRDIERTGVDCLDPFV